jgi:hypothetical protein
MPVCKQCNTGFEITDVDREFYQKVKVPAPTLCPPCRRQRRQAFRNEHVFYKRKCDLCKKDIIGLYPSDSEYKAYCYTCWWSDKWDPTSYGRDFDFSRPFFEQFSALEKEVPHLALFQDDTMENCEYVNYGYHNKSCYLVLGAYLQDVYYSHSVGYCKSCMDCHKCVSCELCYQCVDCNTCYSLYFSQDCNNCSDSYFLKDCSQCQNCFCSAGLRNAKYVFNNEQLSEDEYKKRMGELALTPELIEKFTLARDSFSQKIPKKYMHGSNNENVSGDYIDNSSNLKECWDCFQMEKSAFCDFCAIPSSDLYDCTYAGAGSQLCYEINGSVAFNNCRFVYYGRNLSDCDYCQYVHSSANLFGCIGMSHKNYCILNKQYSKEEYLSLLPRIVAHMMSTKEYGEFFPISSSPFPYNETLAAEHFPLTKEQALAKGFKWRDERKEHRPQTYQVPTNIKEVPDGIKNEVLACKKCSRNFRIVSQELSFYRSHVLPIPSLCPDCRHMVRLALRNPRHLWDRKCAKCQTDIRTSYSPDRPEKVYCEQCYLKEVY